MQPIPLLALTLTLLAPALPAQGVANPGGAGGGVSAGPTTASSSLNNGCNRISRCTFTENMDGGVAIDPDGSVWVGQRLSGADVLFKVDPATCTVLRTLSVPDRIDGIAHDGTYLWVCPSGSGEALKLDPNNGNVLATLSLPVANSLEQITMAGLTWDGSALWASNYHFQFLIRVDPVSGALLDTIYTTTLPRGLGYFQGVLYVTSQAPTIEDAGLYRYDASTGTLLGWCNTVGAFSGTPGGIGLDSRGNAWVSDGNTLDQYDLSYLGTGSLYCSGDASGTLCLCGNIGSAGGGCANSTNLGARLTAIGTSQVANDDLMLVATHLPPNKPGLFFVGDLAINAGAAFGDGLLCARGSIQRLELVVSDDHGEAASTSGIASALGAMVGGTSNFQFWYRDPQGPCGTLFNTSNGVEVIWK